MENLSYDQASASGKQSSGVRYLKKTKDYRTIKKDLLDQLERNGTHGLYYKNLVDDYMDLWVTKCLLVDDIVERGIQVTYSNGGGQTGQKKNDSVELRIKVNVQMLKLLSELGIKPTSVPLLEEGGKSGKGKRDEPEDHL